MKMWYGKKCGTQGTAVCQYCSDVIYYCTDPWQHRIYLFHKITQQNLLVMMVPVLHEILSMNQSKYMLNSA